MSKRKRMIIFIIISVVLVCSIAANIFLALALSKKNKQVDGYKSDLDAKNEENATAMSKITELDGQILDDQKKISDLKETITNLESSQQEESQQVIKLKEQISALEKEIEEKTAEQDALKQRLKELQNVYNIDVNKQLTILNELEALLKNPPKKVTTTEEKTDKVDANGKTVVEKGTKESDAVVSLYYLDIENGYRYSYNSDHVMYSASLIKLPYALGLLQAASADKALHKNDPNYVPFGFDEVFTYTSNLKQEGTGIIKNDPDGTTYTYLELVDYMVRYSDNVAFKALRDKFGYTYLNSYISKNNITSMQKNGIRNLNSFDAAEVMLDVYDFINNDEYYGKFLETSLLNGSHKTMTVNAVYPKKAAHKYGWDDDSYHDMTLVYADSPYIIVFMSDLHQGGNEVNTYIQKVTKKIDQLHENFYKSGN